MTKTPVRILFVCTGNTCRSPTAEWMTRWMLEKIPGQGEAEVASAGLAAHPGAPFSEHAQRLLTERWGQKVDHGARQLTSEMIEEADWVLTMTDSQRQAVLAMSNVAEGRTRLLREFVGGCGDIPDPYGGGRDEYENMVDTVEQAVTALVEKIRVEDEDDEDCPGQ